NQALASTVSFSQIKAAGQSSNLHADLNNDGCEDLVYFNVNTSGFEVVLSKGDGTYAAPVAYKPADSGQATSVGIGDFNSDGQADIVEFGTTTTGPDKLFLYVNDGKGRFSEKASFPTLNEEIDQFVIGDFNHDGIMDIAFLNAAFEDAPPAVAKLAVTASRSGSAMAKAASPSAPSHQPRPWVSWCWVTSMATATPILPWRKQTLTIPTT
ncbi:MAG TPA: VCBS repeat-containing protein, partial [Acidobacteriaceae bacterium]|nr:VCBS repeat-containing protein [Acidobacteriaceae bacterium]